MAEPERVAHIIGKLNAAGVEAVVNNYYRNMDREKYQFDYFIDSDSSFDPPQEMIDLGARYYVIPPYQHLPQYLKELTRLFRENNYKIVHSGMNTLAVFSLYAAKKAGVPIRINHNHSTASRGEIKKNILKYLLRPFAKAFATDYVACSRYAGEWLFGKKSMERGEVTIFNNAIDLNRYRYDEDIRIKKRADLSREFGISLDDGQESRLVIGHVGRFCFQKNHEFLIEIFEKVHDRRPDAVLLLIGIGELTDDIKTLVREKGLTDSVIFTGARSDVNELYQAMDVFVLPSRYEGLPVVGVEAQAAGLPCILSTSMTAETKMLDTTVMIDLSEGAERWADAVLRAVCNDNEQFKGRQDTSDEIRQAGFDISTEGVRLREFYDEKISGLIK